MSLFEQSKKLEPIWVAGHVLTDQDVKTFNRILGSKRYSWLQSEETAKKLKLAVEAMKTHKCKWHPCEICAALKEVDNG